MISIHAPREGGDSNPTQYNYCYVISIHAPREGGDAVVGGQSLLASISIHAPREGGDGQIPLQTQHEIQFQSTPPVRGATTHHGLIHCVRRISIHAPREGGDDRVPVLPRIGPVISIHAPREGGDFWIQWMLCDSKGFQSTPPVRGATIVF